MMEPITIGIKYAKSGFWKDKNSRRPAKVPAVRTGEGKIALAWKENLFSGIQSPVTPLETRIEVIIPNPYITSSGGILILITL